MTGFLWFRARVCALCLGALASVGCAVDFELAGAPGALREAGLPRGRGRPPPVIFEHDVDFDDTASLAQLARLHKTGVIDLKLVSVTYAGAGLPGRGIRHTRCLLERFGITGVPVADSALQGINPFPDALRTTMDSIIWGVTSGCTASQAPSEISAEQAIADVVEGSLEPVTIIATGPVTNVGAALQAGGLATAIRRVWMMGGAIDIEDSPSLNLWADPVSARTVLDELLPVQAIMVANNATQHVPIRMEYIWRLVAEAETPEATYVASMMSNPLFGWVIGSGLPIYWWDPLTTVAATTQDVVHFEMKHMRVAQSGATEVMPHSSRGGSMVSFAMASDQARSRTRSSPI